MMSLPAGGLLERRDELGVGARGGGVGDQVDRGRPRRRPILRCSSCNSTAPMRHALANAATSGRPASRKPRDFINENLSHL